MKPVSLTLPRLVACITFMAVFAMSARISMDADTWWHLRAGQWMVEQRAIARVDHFSYTRAGAAWEYPGWLVQIPMYAIYRALGPGGLNLLTAGMVTLSFAFLWKTLQGGPLLKAFILVLAGAVSGVYWAARPYMVTFLLAAVFLWILENLRWRRSPGAERRLYWLPVLMIIWANSHGGFAVGFLLWGVYLAGDVWLALSAQSLDFSSPRSAINTIQTTFHNLLTAIFNPRTAIFRLLLAGALMILAVCINPYGPVMLAYPFKTVEIGALQDYIQEWQSPDFHSLSVQPFVWLMLITFGVIGASRRRLALTDFLLVSGFFYMGLLAGRNIALFSLAAPPALARHSVELGESISKRYGLQIRIDAPASRKIVLLNWIILAVLSLALLGKIALVFPEKANQDAFTKSLPLEAVEWLRSERPPGRMFNSYNWGGYLLWALPEYPVFVDGRTDLYNDEIISQWLQVARADEGWLDILKHWEVRLVFLERNNPLVSQLPHQGWELLYQDELAAIYGK